MWKSKGENSFFLVILGFKEGGDGQGRVIYNKNYKNGSIGVLLNSASFENRHIHLEAPRVYWKINDSGGLVGEVTYDKSKDSEGKVGVRGGLRINF